MATKHSGRKSILDMIPDDLDAQAVDVPAAFRRSPEPEPAAEPASTDSPEQDRQAAPAEHSPVGLAAVPLPRTRQAEAEVLAADERADLAVCEAAVGNLRTAFWAAGKALSTINQGRLYRETHGTFEQYCLDRWEMSRPQAYRLMEAWPLAEALSPIGDTTLNESQVRELLPVQAKHGQEAAVTVYTTIADAGKVTAATIRGAVSVLPDGEFDQRTAVEQIRGYLAGERPGPATPPAKSLAGGANLLTVEAHRLRHALARPASKATLRAAARDNPDQVKAVLDELLAVVAEIQSWLGDGEPEDA